MASSSGPPHGLSRPKTPKSPKQPDDSSKPLSPPLSLFASAAPSIASPAPQRAVSIPWASSLASGLFPISFETPHASKPPQGSLAFDEAMRSAERLPQPFQASSGNEATVAFTDNILITDLAGTLPAPLPTDPWHRAHARNCAHATAACAACSISLTCCSCRSLRFTPGPAPTSPAALSTRRFRSRSASPALFRTDVGNAPPLQVSTLLLTNTMMKPTLAPLLNPIPVTTSVAHVATTNRPLGL